jgi:hypothetical protein
MLNRTLTIYRPPRVLISGDVTDNWRPDPVRPYSQQLPSDWCAYAKLFRAYNLTDIAIQTIGNHDLFNVDSFDSPLNHAKPYFANESDFRMRSHFFDDQGTRFKIVAINHFLFPTGPICFIQQTFLTKKFIHEISDELSKSDSNVTILLTHYPALRFYPIKKFADVLKKSHNLRFVISGHWHPPAGPFLLHFGDAFEVVGMALFQAPMIGVVTFDNHRAAYHSVNLSSNERAVMTNPAPAHQTSSLDVFHETSTEIRALVFTDNLLNLTVSGALSGRLQLRRRLSGTVFLYSLPMELAPGRYSLRKEGDWQGDVEFVVGETVARFWEVPYVMAPSVAWTTVFVMTYLPALYLVLPFAGVRSLRGLKMRLAGLPRAFRVSLATVTLACVLLPISLFPADGRIGVLHVFGYYLGGGCSWHYIGGQFGIAYLFCVFYPIMVVINGKGRGWIVEAVVCLAALRLYWSRIVALFDMFGAPCAATSPVITIGAVWLWGSLVKWIVWDSRATGEEDEAELLDPGRYKI